MSPRDKVKLFSFPFLNYLWTALAIMHFVVSTGCKRSDDSLSSQLSSSERDHISWAEKASRVLLWDKTLTPDDVHSFRNMNRVEILDSMLKDER
jgi:hypothetical protein